MPFTAPPNAAPARFIAEQAAVQSRGDSAAAAALPSAAVQSRGGSAAAAALPAARGGSAAAAALPAAPCGYSQTGDVVNSTIARGRIAMKALERVNGLVSDSGSQHNKEWISGSGSGSGSQHNKELKVSGSGSQHNTDLVSGSGSQHNEALHKDEGTTGEVIEWTVVEQ